MNSFQKSLRSALIIICVLILSLVLQSTLFRAAAIGGIAPNLLVIAVVSLSLLMGSGKGVFIGFAAGLLEDMVFGPAIGFYALAYSVAGYLSGKLERLIFPDDMLLPVGAVAVGDFLQAFFVYVFSFLIRGRFFFSEFITGTVLPEMLYTSLIALFLYPFILKIYTRWLRTVPESEKNYAKRS